MRLLDHGFVLWLVVIAVTLLAMALFMPPDDPDDPDGRRLVDVLRDWFRRRSAPTSRDARDEQGDTWPR